MLLPGTLCFEHYYDMKLLPAFIAAVLVSLASPAVAQTRMVSLHDTAARAGYQYVWLAAEQAASLTRPGMVILVRPGNQFYEVNDRSEAASAIPRSAGSDILVPPSLAQRIRLLAAPRTEAQAAQMAPLTITETPVLGALSLSVTNAEGQEAIVVSGRGPSLAPVQLVLVGTLSSEIPTVLISRHDLRIGRSGRFSTTIPIAPNFSRGTILTVRATSLDTVASAEAKLLVGSPNPHVTVPAEKLPPGF